MNQDLSVLQVFVFHQHSALHIQGQDVRDLLNRVLTLNVKTLGSNEGAFTFLLNARGRMRESFELLQGSEETEWWALSSSDRTSSLAQNLDMYVFGEDISFTPLSWSCLRIHGSTDQFKAQESTLSQALSTVTGSPIINLDPPAWSALTPKTRASKSTHSTQLPAHHWFHCERAGGRWVYAPRINALSQETADVKSSTPLPQVQREWWGPSEHVERLAELLSTAELSAAGWQVLHEEVYHSQRVKWGVPASPFEYMEERSPLDVGLIGISEGKGCYPGQEVIVRTIALGRPAYALVHLSCVDSESAELKSVELKSVELKSVELESLEQLTLPAPLYTDSNTGSDQEMGQLTSLGIERTSSLEPEVRSCYALALVKTKSLTYKRWHTACGLHFQLVESSDPT